MKILIAGDISLQDRAAKVHWEESQMSNAFACVKHLVSSCDYAFVNLESPVTDSIKPLLKDGPNLRNPSVVLDIIKYCGFKAVTLSNNHLKDYGSKGVVDTIHSCKEHRIELVGAGYDLYEARRTLIIKEEGLSVGIVNVCEHESSIATRTSAGANPLDFTYLHHDIKKLRKQVNKIIVIIHGGREHYQLPTPRMKREYQLIADYGADIVVNHHQHCYSGYEIYNGKPIFYGLGNFFFDNPLKRNDKWNIGLLLMIELRKDGTDFKLIPIEQCNADMVISVHDYAMVKEDIEKLNKVIANDELLENAFDGMVKSTKPLYPFLPYGNHYLRALYNRGYLPSFISNRNKAMIENAVSCETHREVLLRFFEILDNNE